MDSSKVTFIRVEALPSATLDENAIVVLSADFATYFGLEGSALRIWDLISDQKSLEDIVEVLTAEFDVDRSLCAEETLSFLENLIAHGIAKKTERS